VSEKEATARIKINKLLEAAEWRFFPAGDSPPNIRLELTVTINPADLDALGDNFEKTKRGFVDFLLLVLARECGSVACRSQCARCHAGSARDRDLGESVGDIRPDQNRRGIARFRALHPGDQRSLPGRCW
jgi:hypothetical protein